MIESSRGRKHYSVDYERRTACAKELDSRKDQLAAAIVEAQYRASPMLLKRWGERGRGKSLADAKHTLAVLSEAMILGDMAAFPRYILWLDKVLASAGLPRKLLKTHLELMKEHLNAGLSSDCEKTAGRHVEAALAGLAAAAEKKK